MQQLNNMDIAILVIVGISALIALGRGLVKEVLSIVGWVLAGAAVIYLLPVLNPFTLKYIESGWMAGIATAAFILIVFMIVWIYATAGVVGKIRTSKLSGLDRLRSVCFWHSSGFSAYRSYVYSHQLDDAGQITARFA